MTLEETKDVIRSLTPNERMELYRWLDYQIAVESRASDFRSRIGAERSIEIRYAIQAIVDQRKIDSLATSSVKCSNSCPVQGSRRPEEECRLEA
jgi:hypothetical protein